MPPSTSGRKSPDSPGFSLRNILANGELVGSTPAGDLLRIDTAHVKVKIILFYLLTKGVWQFFDSELMPNEWTKDTVEFLVEYREHRGALTAGVFLNQPLVPVQLNSAPKKQEEALNHNFPKIRELGIMLLEILLGRQIESFRGLPEFAAYLPGGKPTPYADYRIAKWLFDKKVKMDQQIAKPLINVIERCLDAFFFPKLLAPGKSKDEADTNRLRDAMYEKLVAPLDLLVKTNYDNTHVKQGNYRDFVDALDDDRRDDTGHGTYLARLICKIMPKVELYAARVLKDGLLSEESCGLVENAIDWAAGKEVDIILMASGGNKDYDNVRRAINRLPDTTLFVAAAGNLPQCKRVTFPARMQRNVMCIFAATANNKNSRALNPPPLSRGYSFAILGEAVQPEGNWGNPQSGTSYAAAIAAAFAGMLLHFSWQALPEGENDPLDLQHCLHERMNPIFEELSKNQQDGGYECISPSHLLNIIREEFTEQEKRRKIRNFLSDVIAQQRS
ncbi:hypothetical protein NEMBOFW57_000040 [Staphylotrichum longicolle]|uniref:Peptidase S8/S53 domain-containing protein n=1 Tax=Staphylotrichum longicolle TaxID=669026 RepID=A0AAD4F3C1_9PEZI|nr:hypothetical protein NEMBOFW57_000040 [Staphylotrichum longicolle]